MQRSFVRRTAVGVLLAGSVGACQTFVPVDARAVPEGTPVRVTLTPEEAARQAEAIGELTQRVEGTVTAAENGSAGLPLTIPSRGSTPASTARFNTFVSVQWDGIRTVEEKRFSWARTGLLAAVGAVATVVILSVTEGSSEGGPGEGPGENSDVRIPIFTLHR